jgi:hypothetical protein
MTAPTTTFDAARVELLLGELRLPGVKMMWAKLATHWRRPFPSSSSIAVRTPAARRSP